MSEYVQGDPLELVREICLSFPETSERQGDANAFRIRNRNFVVYWPNWHVDHRPSIWCKAPPGAQEEMIAIDGTRYFVPPWFGRFGWLGIRLSPLPDRDELGEILTEAYCLAAPKRLSARVRAVR